MTTETEDVFNPEYTDAELKDGGGVRADAFLRISDGDQAEIVFIGKFDGIDCVYAGHSIVYDPDAHGPRNDPVKVTTKYLLNVAQKMMDGAWRPTTIEMSWTTRGKYLAALESGANGKYTFTYKRQGGKRDNTEYYFTPNLRRVLGDEDLDTIRALHYPNLRALAESEYSPGKDDPPPQVVEPKEDAKPRPDSLPKAEGEVPF